MKKKVLFSIIVTLVISTATACGTEQTAAVSTDTTSTVSESTVSEDVAIADDTPDETATETEGASEARTVSDIDLAFEITSDTDVYEYVYIDGVREYVLKDEGLLTGTLVHAYGETSDGYYQVEYGTENGYILKDSEGLSETDIGYILSDVTKNYEMLFDYTLYNGPSIHYGKSDMQLSKGDTVEIIGIAENGWLKTKDGFISFNGFAKEIVPKDTTVATTTTEAPATDTTTTVSTTETTTTSDTCSTETSVVSDATTTTTNVTTPTVSTSGSGITEQQAIAKIAELVKTYPAGTSWGWDKSYTANNGKSYVACDAFAYMASDYIFGSASYTQIPFNINTVRAGDIIVGTSGHTSICMGVVVTGGSNTGDTPNKIIVGHGNVDGDYYDNGGHYQLDNGGHVVWLTYKAASDISYVITRYNNTAFVRNYSSTIVKDVQGENTFFNYKCYDFDPQKAISSTQSLYFSDGTGYVLYAPQGDLGWYYMNQMPYGSYYNYDLDIIEDIYIDY